MGPLYISESLENGELRIDGGLSVNASYGFGLFGGGGIN